ncbi:MAG: hypothetical protein NTX50_28265 [Candidatus Sumerlaeota bacterium]|nr:hypothetical protein [Candidatus Sumerlaeota bacterium]
MKTFVKSMALMAVVSAMFLGSATMVLAQKAAKGDKPTVGTVKVTLDDAKKVTEITITDKAGTAVKVNLDAKGLELKDYDGKKVAAKGTVADGKITVTEYKEVVAGAKKAK